MTRQSQSGFQLIVVSGTHHRGGGPSCRQEVLRSLSHFSAGESGCSGEGAGSFADSCRLWDLPLLLLCLSPINTLVMTRRLSAALEGVLGWRDAVGLRHATATVSWQGEGSSIIA